MMRFWLWWGKATVVVVRRRVRRSVVRRVEWGDGECIVLRLLIMVIVVVDIGFEGFQVG